jgi:hypothetical protein
MCFSTGFEDGIGGRRSATRTAVGQATAPFRVADLQRGCPGVSLDVIRRVLKNLCAAQRVECLGCGQNAEWRKTGLRK